MNKINQPTSFSQPAKWVLGIFSFLAILIWAAVAQTPDKSLHIYFLDVGQGDSIYVRAPNNVDLLIDGGPDKNVLSELGQVMPFWDHKIDYVMLTHPHADHLTGLINVLNRYEVGEIIATDASNTTSEYLAWLEEIKDKKIPYKLARAGDKIALDDSTKLDILWPRDSYLNQTVDNLNNTAVVAKLTYNKFSALFTGDAEVAVQRFLLTANGQQLKADVLKVPHHGSSNAAELSFLKAVSPSLAVISVGLNNQFGHPAAPTLKKYEEIGATVYRTDQHGTIEIISDGQTYWEKIGE